LEPSPVASFLDLFVESFFGAISCKKITFGKLVQENQLKQKPNQAKMAYTSFQQNANINMNFKRKNLHIDVGSSGLGIIKKGG